MEIEIRFLHVVGYSRLRSGKNLKEVQNGGFTPFTEEKHKHLV